MLDISKYIIQTQNGEDFDIRAYEDNEQMIYLTQAKQKKEFRKVAGSRAPVSSFLSRLKKIKGR